MNDHITTTQFLFEYFGNFGRELGTIGDNKIYQWYTDNPNDLLDLINSSRIKKTPCYQSVQPRIAHDKVLGIESLFFDFDYGKKSDNISPNKIDLLKQKTKLEVQIFLKNIKNMNSIHPLIKKTNKGYHIHIFFDSIFQINMDNFKFWKIVYEKLQQDFLFRDFVFCDTTSIGDLKRLARVPFSTHEKSGQEVILLNMDLEPDKIRGLSYYTEFGLKKENIIGKLDEAKKIIDKQIENNKIAKEDMEKRKNSGEINQIRPCFMKRLEKCEMPHFMRLALLIEAYYSGITECEALVNLYRTLNDFDESKTRYQCNWFLEHKSNILPYKCITIQSKGWCLGNNCPFKIKEK